MGGHVKKDDMAWETRTSGHHSLTDGVCLVLVKNTNGSIVAF